MPEIIDARRALSINPLKVCQRAGAVLAFLGLARSLPLEHGVRGCAAFSKLFFMRHFREPIPLQTSAVDQSATILGTDGNLLLALRTMVDASHPDVVGLVATTLSEFQGTDMLRAIADFRRESPQHGKVSIIPVISVDGMDSLEIGFARAVEAIITTLVVPARHGANESRRVNVLASSMLTPGDVQVLKDWISAFGLVPVVLPDLDASLDGHMVEAGFSPLTYGGTSRADIEGMGQAVATVVVGSSLYHAADLLRERSAVPDYRFDGLMGLEACDRLTALLQTLSHARVPERLSRQRAQLLDAMVDSQFYTAGTSAVLAADADLLVTLASFLESNGVRIPLAVTPARVPSLSAIRALRVLVGDLDDFETTSRNVSPHLLLANSHAVPIAARLGLPLLRVGYPQHDWFGAHAKAWIGYSGTRQALFDVANLLLHTQRGPQPYVSIYKRDMPAGRPAASDASVSVTRGMPT